MNHLISFGVLASVRGYSRACGLFLPPRLVFGVRERGAGHCAVFMKRDSIVLSLFRESISEFVVVGEYLYSINYFHS